MPRQVITFTIGEECLGIDVMAIREIRVWSPVSKIPHAPAHVHGVVNLRGLVLPIIDLSACLGWPANVPSERHVIIVAELGDGLRGLVVDGVNDIVTLDAPLQPPPALGAGGRPEFLEGVAAADERMILIVSIAQLASDCSDLDLLAA